MVLLIHGVALGTRAAEKTKCRHQNSTSPVTKWRLLFDHGVVEVKLSATLTRRDVGGLKILREAAGKRFRRGFVLYTGKTVVPLDEQLMAVPMCNLWE